MISLKISPELARIVAHICADGYIRKGKQRRCNSELKEHPRINIFRNKYYVRYVNTEPILVQQFIDDVKKEFNRSVIILRRYEYEISGKKVYDLIKGLGAGKSREWFISDNILKSDISIKIEWIKSFFDDESYVCESHKRIDINSVNKLGLIQIRKILDELGIQSSLLGPYAHFYDDKVRYTYRIGIYRNYLKKYRDIIGFYHPKKAEDLNNIIYSLK